MSSTQPTYFASFIQTSTPAQWAAFQCVLGSSDTKLNTALNYLKISPEAIAPALRDQCLYTAEKWMSRSSNRPQVLMALFRMGRLFDAKQTSDDVGPQVLYLRRSAEKVVDGKVLVGSDKKAHSMASDDSPYRKRVVPIRDVLGPLQNVILGPYSTTEEKIEAARRLNQRLTDGPIDREELKVLCHDLLVNASSSLFVEDIPTLREELLAGVLILLNHPDMESLLREDEGLYNSFCFLIKDLKSKPWKQEVVCEEGVFKIVDRYAVIRERVLKIGEYLVSRNIRGIANDPQIMRSLELLKIAHTHDGLHDLTPEEVAGTQASSLYSIPGSGKGIDWIRSGAVIGAVTVWSAAFIPIAIAAVLTTVHMAIVYGSEFANTPGLFFEHFFEFFKYALLDAVLILILNGLLKVGGLASESFFRYEESHPLYYRVMSLKRAERRRSQLSDRFKDLEFHQSLVTGVRVSADDPANQDGREAEGNSDSQYDKGLKKKK